MDGVARSVKDDKEVGRWLFVASVEHFVFLATINQ